MAELRAKLENEFSEWLRHNYRTEEDREFREYLELEYPWLFAEIDDLDEDDRKWVRYEFNLYVNGLYDPIRRI